MTVDFEFFLLNHTGDICIFQNSPLSPAELLNIALFIVSVCRNDSETLGQSYTFIRHVPNPENILSKVISVEQFL